MRKAVPVIGLLVDVAAFMYGLGYVLQRIYLGMRLESGFAGMSG